MHFVQILFYGLRFVALAAALKKGELGQILKKKIAHAKQFHNENNAQDDVKIVQILRINCKLRSRSILTTKDK
ncbi:hypothetical protein A7T58_09690 [Salmonella enterica subsp. diarizonae serovar 16:z10:e,n,x,z15]|nr:hypothetical protein A7T58_09690 [Salmonella enterica subsp. diarizonae serovar 16:z10:e,n,x,z15]OHG38523.1 hypothetical protein A7T60_12345 [Salmonella enterica subsp. diarizonae serovar 16:z10:e,n,x,z15]OHK48155.1 hypothetical protein A7S73_10210 [Salmonella enterica subsp. enterica serovar Mbandaka]OHK70878.1 hypothetical protein A7S80_11260 [Salmonella enterica subsp. enterica serovar Mbandaka]